MNVPITGTTDPAISMNGIRRLRVGVVTAMMVVVALAAGDIFGETNIWFVVAPLAVGASAMLSHRRLTFLAATIVGSAAATVTIVLTAGGRLGDVATALTAGPQRLLTSNWPSPALADLAGTVGVFLCVATALAAFAAYRPTLHLAPLVPVAIAYIGVIALSAPLGMRPIWLVGLGVLSLALAALRPEQDHRLRDRLALLRGERRMLLVSSIALVIGAVAAIPLVYDDRSDPRRVEPAERSVALLDPIEAAIALQAIDPPIDLHAVTVVGDQAPTKWRTAALVNYDGERWESEVTLRPIGQRLGSASNDVIEASVRFLDDGQQLVPLPGRPVVVDAMIEADDDRNVVRLVDSPDDDDVIQISANRGTDRAALASGRIGTRELDENASGLTDIAQSIAATGGADSSTSLFGQLEAIETVMRNDFSLRPDTAGGGLQRTLINRFLRDTKQGNAEQFSVAFVLLARSLGVDARIATGFDVDPSRIASGDGRTAIAITSTDAAVWPEVRIDEEWVAFDPVPEEEASDVAPEQPGSQSPNPAAVQPPIPPPSETNDEPIVTEDEAESDVRGSLPTAVTWFLRGAAAAGVFLVPLLLGCAVVLATKWRRRRRLARRNPVEQITGAWALATNHLVDAGLSIPVTLTNNEIAEVGEAFVPNAHRELQRLSSLATATTFGSPARPDLLAQDARFCLEAVRRSLIESRSTWQRVRWHLSLRSLRQRTASPVV